MWALEYKCNEGKEFILFTLNPQSLEKCLAHSRPSTVTCMNNYMSSCVTHELNSKTSWNEDCTFWKESLGMRSTKVRTQMDKGTQTKRYRWVFMSIVRVSQEIQSIHWLSVSKEACCNIYLFSVTLNFFNIWKLYHRKKKLRQKIHFGIICKSPHEKCRREQVQLSKDGTAIISQKRSFSYRLHRA